MRDVLVAEGIAPLRLIARGYGSTQPLVPERTAADRLTNTRIDFVVAATADHQLSR